MISRKLESIPTSGIIFDLVESWIPTIKLQFICILKLWKKGRTMLIFIVQLFYLFIACVRFRGRFLFIANFASRTPFEMAFNTFFIYRFLSFLRTNCYNIRQIYWSMFVPLGCQFRAYYCISKEHLMNWFLVHDFFVYIPILPFLIPNWSVNLEICVLNFINLSYLPGALSCFQKTSGRTDRSTQ